MNPCLTVGAGTIHEWEGLLFAIDAQGRGLGPFDAFCDFLSEEADRVHCHMDNVCSPAGSSVLSVYRWCGGYLVHGDLVGDPPDRAFPTLESALDHLYRAGWWVNDGAEMTTTEMSTAEIAARFRLRPGAYDEPMTIRVNGEDVCFPPEPDTEASS